MVREELGAEIEEIFDEWDWNPLGAASLGMFLVLKFYKSAPYK